MDLIEILLIEDNSCDEELILRSFKKANLKNKVHIIRDGQAALDFLLSAESVSLKFIMLDLKLPKVSGLEILAELRKDDRLKKVPVVVLSSSAEDPDVLKSYELGANSFVTKPIDFTQFAEVITALGFYWGIINKICY